MAVLGSVAQKAFSVTRLGITTPDFTGTQGQISHVGGEATTAAGTKMSPEGALRVAAVWIAVTVIADEVSSLVAKLIRREDAKREPVRPPELAALWGKPNPDQTAMGITATECLSLMLWGNTYTMLGWTNGGALDVRWPIDPNGVKLERTSDMGIRLISQGQGELVNRPGRRPEFLHIPLFTLPGRMMGLSPVEMAANLLGLSAAYDLTAARLMGRGMNPTAVLTVGEPVERDAAAELSRRMERVHGGSDNSGRVVVVGGKDIKLERLTMSMADAEFIEQRQDVFQVVMALFRVPPTVAGMVDKPSTWGTGVAEFARGLERFTLRPVVQRFQVAYEDAILRWVDEQLQYRMVFDSLLSASPKERTEIQRLNLMNGMTSVERVLAQNDEPPFEEGETVYSSLAFADRDLARLRQQAETVAALVRAGFDPAQSLAAVGLEGIDHLGPLPVTVQSGE